MKPGSHISCSREVESMGECENWTSTFPSELPLWELEFRWSLEFSESNFMGQNPLDWIVPYIIGKILKRRCLKWSYMTHLDIWSTNYAQKKGQESYCQKVKNRLNFFVCRWRATYHWKTINEGYNFAWDLISIKGLHRTLCTPKVTGVPTLGISGLSLGSLGIKCHLDARLVARVYYKGEGGGFPKSKPWWILWVWICSWFFLAPKVF
jgi:hypothetical protein